MNPVSRRECLKAAGVAVALPWLESLCARSARSAEPAPVPRTVIVCTSLGVHAPYLFPSETGRDYSPTPYLEWLKEHRQHFTLISGLSHPEQSGADGHSSEITWLTAARHPGLAGFRNSVSIDQLLAERIGLHTRFPSLQMGTNGTSQSYTRSGVMIPAEYKPSRLFGKLFLDGSAEEVAAQRQKLREGRSILDAVRDEAQRLSRRSPAADRTKLDEYFSSVREMEERLVKADEWAQRPKPKVETPAPQDIAEEKDLIGRMTLLFDLIPLILQSDSTRVVTVLVQGRNDVPPVPGVSIDHHNLSHHGQDDEKIRQLRLIEEAQFRALAGLYAALQAASEGSRTLLDQTAVLFGSNLGNANSHDTRNLPILLAGGGFQHGQHLALDRQHNTPLSNLFVQLLQRMQVDVDRFGSSTADHVPGLET